ncbi:hypothetical protein HMPREF0973_01753 [Prevotella veroralis F0319]|uniref:Uncharacterized protein n=1 Tax=Prevotella veroralis F0319 TaxID=649761 RepID=C9MQ54_9BACT|nr:hypothetical protein HMPREF0973_01753 [Prevotella veroralis F0319]
MKTNSKKGAIRNAKKSSRTKLKLFANSFLFVRELFIKSFINHLKGRDK